MEKDIRASQRVAGVLEVWSHKNKIDRKQSLDLLCSFARIAEVCDRKQMQKILELAVVEFHDIPR